MNSFMINKLHEQKDTPEFVDHCNHPEGTYVGSIVDGISTYKHTWLDIYVYDSSTNKVSQDVCIRYGNEPHEYMSPGSLLTILNFPQHDIYVLVIHVLLKKGQIKWMRKK